MKYFFAIVSVLILVLVIGGFAFYFGQQSANQSREMTTTPTGQSPLGGANDQTENTPTAEPTEVRGKKIEGGGLYVFAKYTGVIPQDWLSTTEQTEVTNNLTLTKQGYKITIAQIPSEGVKCIYSQGEQGDFTQYYSTYVEIGNSSGYTLRRSSSAPLTSWSVCQKSTGGTYQFPTTFGYITVTNPANPSTDIMAEIDGILASLTKN